MRNKVRYSIYLSLLLFSTICILPTHSNPSRSPSTGKDSNTANPLLVQVNLNTEKSSLKTQAITTTDSFAYIWATILGFQLLNVTFYACLLIGLMYNPGFSIAAYLIASVFSVVLAALNVTKVFVTISRLIMTVLTAVLFITFSCFTMYMIYTMKDPQLALEAGSVQAEEKLDKKETKAFLDYTQDEEEEIFLQNEETRIEPEHKTSLRKWFSLNFIGNRIKRFILCVVMLMIAELSDQTLRVIFRLRRTDGINKVIGAGVLAYLVCAMIIFIVTALIKEFVIKKLAVNHVKTTKYTGCVGLIFLGIMPAIINYKVNMN